MATDQNLRCCVPGCPSSLGQDDTINFHYFPRKEGDTCVRLLNEQGNIEEISRYEAWKRILQLKQPVTDQMCVCSMHFKNDDFNTTDGNHFERYLNRNAIPTLNLQHLHMPSSDTSKRSLRIKSDKELLSPNKSSLAFTRPPEDSLPATHGGKLQTSHLDIGNIERAVQLVNSKGGGIICRILPEKSNYHTLVPLTNADIKKITQSKISVKSGGIKRKLSSRDLQQNSANAGSFTKPANQQQLKKPGNLKRPRVSTQGGDPLNNSRVRNQNVSPPQVFFVDLGNQDMTESYAKQAAVNKPEMASREIVVDNSQGPRNNAQTPSVPGTPQLNSKSGSSIIILKKVPKPVGIKLKPTKNITMKAVITDFIVSENEAQKQRKPTAPLKNEAIISLGRETTKQTIKNTIVVEPSAPNENRSVKIYTAQGHQETGRSTAPVKESNIRINGPIRTAEEINKENVIDLCTEDVDSNKSEDVAVDTGLAKNRKPYIPINEYCAFVNCASHIRQHVKKIRFPSIEATWKIWLKNAGVPSFFPRDNLKRLFVCGKHFRKQQFTRWETLKPGSVPEEYQRYNDSTAVDTNIHWLRKKKRTNCYSTLATKTATKPPAKPNDSNNGLGIQRNNSMQSGGGKCCIKKCEATSNSTVLHQFPRIKDFVKDYRLSKKVIDWYEKRKICEKHLEHQFFKDGVLNQDALVLLSLKAPPKQTELNKEMEDDIVSVDEDEISLSETGKPYTPIQEFCAVINCATHYSELMEKFLFPTHEILLHSWRKYAGIPSSFPKADVKRLFVCSKHFNKGHFNSWGCLKALSLLENYQVYKDPTATDNNPHWRRKKLMTNCFLPRIEPKTNGESNCGNGEEGMMPTINDKSQEEEMTANNDGSEERVAIASGDNLQLAVETCCIEDCQENSISTVMYKFPALKVIMYLINQNKLSKDNLEFYKNQKICGKHLNHRFFNEAVLTKESVSLLNQMNSETTENPSDENCIIDLYTEQNNLNTSDAQIGTIAEMNEGQTITNIYGELDSNRNSTATAGAERREETERVYKPIRQYCAVMNCATHIRKAVKKFRFPTKQPILKTWLKNAGIPSLLSETDLKHLFVCGKHFKESQFTNWDTLRPSSVPQEHHLYKDPNAVDSNPHWIRKKHLTSLNIDLISNTQTQREICCIKNCPANSLSTTLHDFPCLTTLVKHGKLSNHVLKFYENRKICGKHLEHQFFKDGILTHEVLALLDLVVLQDKNKRIKIISEPVWQKFGIDRPNKADVDFYGDVKGKAILRPSSIEFPYIRSEIKFPEGNMFNANQFHYQLQRFTDTDQDDQLDDKPKDGKRVQIHTALIIDDDSETAVIEVIRDALMRNSKRRKRHPPVKDP